MDNNSLEEKIKAEKLLVNLEERQPGQGAILGGFIYGMLKTFPLQFEFIQEQVKILNNPIISSKEGFNEAKKYGYCAGALFWYIGPPTLGWFIYDIFS